MNTFVTIAGNLTRDPELRFTQGGKAVCNLSVAVTPRRRDERTGQWEDGQTSFYNAGVWGPAAENTAESLAKGDRVLVTGRLVEREWEQEGQSRRRHEIVADEIGVSLQFATAKPAKARRVEQHTERGDEPPF